MANAELRLEVTHSAAPRTVWRRAVTLPAGATVRDALAESGLLDAVPGLSLDALSVGVWGTLCGLDQRLRDGDRVEVYRGLQVDPMEARRRRQGTRRSTPKAMAERLTRPG